MEKTIEVDEIFKILNQIFTNIGVEGDISTLEEVTDPELYIQIFNIMFPFLTDNTNEIYMIKDEPGNQMQLLLNILSENILRMDLSHINGKNHFRIKFQS